MPNTIIVVHGVGRAAPATVASAVARTLRFGAARQSTVYADGHALVEIRDEISGDSVLEVNWSDLLRPEAAPISVARHLWYILSSMVDVATAPRAGWANPVAWVYRVALFTFTPGLVALTFATAVAVSLPVWWQRSLLLAVLLVGFVLLAVWLQGQGSPVVVAVGDTSGGGPYPRQQRAGARDRLGGRDLESCPNHGVPRGRGVAGRRGRHRLDPAARKGSGGHVGLCRPPVHALSRHQQRDGLVRIPGLSMISDLSDGGGYLKWEATALSGIARDVYPQMEAAATVVIGLVGLLAILLPLIWYALARPGREASSANGKGRGAQNGLMVFLIVAPLLLLGLGLFCVWAWYRCADERCVYFFPAPERSIIEIYRTSVSRTLFLLGWLVGPFAMALDVIGDVVFYLQPNRRHPAAIGDICRDRVKAALAFARAGQGNTTVLAHSQGSIIAADLRLRKELVEPMITIGCPLGSLYGRFLTGTAVPGSGPAWTTWLNAYRDGDVIAGPVDGVHNENLGPGRHTDYWSDEKLAALLRSVTGRDDRTT